MGVRFRLRRVLGVLHRSLCLRDPPDLRPGVRGDLLQGETSRGGRRGSIILTQDVTLVSVSFRQGNGYSLWALPVPAAPSLKNVNSSQKSTLTH